MSNTTRKAGDVLQALAVANTTREHPTLTTEAQAALCADLLELIGEDEVPYTDLASETDALRRNNLRAELRTKVKQYFGQGEE